MDKKELISEQGLSSIASSSIALESKADSKMNVYDSEFYNAQSKDSKISSEIVLKELFNLVPVPKTAVDVGCGVGSWTSTLKQYCTGVVLGIDGDYVCRDSLMIDRQEFLAADLNFPIYPRINKRFGLAISLEVAEHLPESRAESFVQDLTDLSDMVLFSAAIPLQAGTNHINCQWQSYWVAKFFARGYQPNFELRDKIWHKDNICYWYRQNIILFVKSNRIHPVSCIDVVHPHFLISHDHELNKKINQLTAKCDFLATTGSQK